MLTPEEDVEITSLRKRGWTISAIARHVGHDRKTVRSYLSGEREPGVRAKHEPDPFDRFEPYVRQRLADDRHVWATTLLGEVVAGSVILTTNRGVGAWGEIFADTTIAAAMLDRLLHRSVVISITGDSYRMRAHRARSHKLTKGGDA